MRVKTWLGVSGLALLVGTTAADAGWVRIDTFDTYTVGQNLNGLGSWTASTANGAGTIVADPLMPGNKCAQVTRIPYSDRGGHCNLGGCAIGAEGTGTVFFRAARVSTSSFSIGMADFAFDVNKEYGENQIKTRHRGDAAIVAGNTTLNYSNGSMGTGVWLKYWLVVYNATDKWEIYQEGNDVPVQTKLAAGATSLFTFATSTTNSLTHFGCMLNQWGGNPDTLYFDDVYVDNGGVNLKDPTLETTGTVFLIR